MPFRARNPYYLRISQRSVLPLYVFLDERHIDWMSDKVLQYVLADLRPLILPKLKAESDVYLGLGGPPNTTKGTVDVYKGEFYQFCFFFRKTEPHSVLIKTRTFVAAPPQSKLMPPPHPQSSRPGKDKGKRKGRTLKESTRKSSRKKCKTKGKGKANMELGEDDESAVSSEGDSAGETGFKDQILFGPPRRSQRAKNLVAKGYARHVAEADGASVTDPETEMTILLDESPEIIAPDALHAPDLQIDEGQENSQPNQITESREPALPANDTGTTIHIDLDIEDEEQKPKPMLQLRYQGFGIYGHCLCVVVEPFPPIRSSSRAPSVALPRETSLRPPSLDFSSTRERLREGTPLFLPDYDRRSETPAPQQKSENARFNQPNFYSAEGADDNGGMMEFSEVLNAAGDFQAALDNDDEMDGAVFFGDADEGREL